MDIVEVQQQSHAYALAKGFWEHDNGEHTVDSEKIALMHSELSEALQALRDYDMPQVEMELADCVIRIMDYMERRQLSLARGILKVQAKSKDRPPMHGHQW